MAQPVKRSYQSRARDASAQQTRRAILDAARELFLQRGYGGLTMQAVADASGVALDTVYASIGPKPVLVRLLIETAISGRDTPVSARERDYVRQVRAAESAAEKLELYAAAITKIHGRLAPLVQALRAAAPSQPELGALWQEIAARRARNMREFADDLLATGEIRPDIERTVLADIIWSMNSPEYYTLLVHDRRWPDRRFQRWLSDAWKRLLLEDQPRSPASSTAP